MTPDHPLTDQPEDQPVATRARIIDTRMSPKGVLPRHLQTWLMAGIALVILGIILVTGRPEPLPAEHTREANEQSPSLLPPDRVRTYQQRVNEQEARLRKELAEAQHQDRAIDREPRETVAADPLLEERRRRNYQSLFADNVTLSRRPPNEHPSADVSRSASDRGPNEMTQMPVPVPFWPTLPDTVPLPASSTARPQPDTLRAKAAVTADSSPTPKANAALDNTRVTQTDPITLAGPLHRLLEGTFIEAVLTNRLDGGSSGAVNCLVTTPVYSHSRQHVLIPAGARVLGTAAPVQTFGESRLAVRFHRLIMPDGRTYSLDRFTGLNQAGDAGLKDQVDRHYWQVFGASLAIGVLSGLAQYQTRGPADPEVGFGDTYRQGVGTSLASSAGRIMDRFLNVLPTVTIREGHRVRIYLTSDFDLPEYVGG